MGSFIRFVLVRLGLLARGVYELRLAWIIITAFFTEGNPVAAWTYLSAEMPWWQILTNIGFFVLDVYTIFIITRFALQYWHRRHEAKKLVHLRITMPKNDSKLDNEKRTEKDFKEQIGKAEQFFRALYETRDLNLYNIFIKRWLWGKPFISFELQFENQELSFVVVCDPYYRAIVEKQVTAFFESAEIEPIPEKKRFDINPKGNTANGYYMFAKEDFWYPIQTYKNLEEDALNDVANSFSSLTEAERAVVQVIIHPKSKKWRKKAQIKGTELFKGKGKKDGFKLKIPIISPILSILWWPIKVVFTGYDPQVDSLSNEPGASGGDSYVRMLQTEEEIAKHIGEKAVQNGFDTVIRILASSPNPMRTQEILNGAFVAFNAFKGKGKNYFENRRIIFINAINSPLIRHNFKYRLKSFLEKNSILCEEELASIYHFPDARYNRIPTIRWLPYKVLPPPINLPEEGVIVGNSVYRGITKPARIMRGDRTRHMYVLGKSGSGKSVLLEYMAGQDVQNGDGVGVIDPHGDLVEDVLSRVPKERAKDIVVFDPGDRERPMGLNILEAKTEEEQDRASLDAMEIFIKLFGNEIFGPRIQHYFRNGCLTLMADKDEGATLIDIPRLFIDDDFQRYKVSKVQNAVVRAFWENEMANTGDREKQEMIPYFTSKFGPFVTNTTMRNIIGQTKSAFNVRESMDNQKVLLINLSKGKIGAINAQLLGLIMVAKINQAAMGRVDIAKEDRKDFYLYVDEFQNFATDTFASILSEARKYRLNLIMAHQYIAQLSESAGGVAVGQKDSKIRDAVFGNVGSMLSFKVGAEDAEYLEKEYAPLLSQQDILGMANYKAYIKLNINNSTSRPFSIESIWDPDGRNYKIAEVIKKYSRMKYGRKKEFVDAEIEARMGIGNLQAIAETAKADPTVPNELLGDTPSGATQKVQPVKDEHVDNPAPHTTVQPDTAHVPPAAKLAPPVNPTAPIATKVTPMPTPAPIPKPVTPTPVSTTTPTTSTPVQPQNVINPGGVDPTKAKLPPSGPTG